MTELHMRHSQSTTELSPPVKYDWGLHYAFFSVWSYNKKDLQFWFSVKTVTDLNWDQAIQESQLSPIDNTALWNYSEKIDQPEV